MADNHSKKEALMDEAFVTGIMLKEGYKSTEDCKHPVFVGNIKDHEFFKSKFSCSWQINDFNNLEGLHRRHLITGFGPTNSPTGGTLSVILRALFFSKFSGIDSTIIISNLGAFNSRNISLEKAENLTQRFIAFLKALNYQGEVRSHADKDLLVTSAFTSKVTRIEDFEKNQEATAKLYSKMGIQGGNFGTYFDMNLTVSDILLPLIRDKKERVLVFVGIEEYYFPKLAQIVIQRLVSQYSNIFVPAGAKVSAIFGRLIEGLNGFPKMSKSIPTSAINLSDSEKEISKKVLECRKEDEKVILQMISLVSDWSALKITEAAHAYNEDNLLWRVYKQEYLEYYLKIRKIWNSTAPKKYYVFDLKKGFFSS